jgi:hypothetical protein
MLEFYIIVRKYKYVNLVDTILTLVLFSLCYYFSEKDEKSLVILFMVLIFISLIWKIWFGFSVKTYKEIGKISFSKDCINVNDEKVIDPKNKTLYHLEINGYKGESSSLRSFVPNNGTGNYLIYQKERFEFLIDNQHKHAALIGLKKDW